MIRKATPAHHSSPVRNQTTKATRAAGIKIKNKRITKIIIRPIMISPISPTKSKYSKLGCHQPRLWYVTIIRFCWKIKSRSIRNT